MAKTKGATKAGINKSTAKSKTSAGRKWSKKVTESSDALDLKSKIFTKDDPHAIALSLKRSAEKAKEKKERPINRLCRC